MKIAMFDCRKVDNNAWSPTIHESGFLETLTFVEEWIRFFHRASGKT